MASLNRRRFLKWTLGGFAALSTAAIAGGVGISLIPDVPAAANAPWRTAGQGRNPRERALSYAALAPNPHNLQSWLIELIGDDRMRLYVDRRRLLPETDPVNRQIVIGQGCFIETLALAAGLEGYRAEVTLFPEGAFATNGVDHRPVAEVRLIAGGQADPLAHAITQRRSVKEPFDVTKIPSNGQLRALTALSTADARLAATASPDRVKRLRDLLYVGMEIETRLPRTFLESVKLMRIGAEEITRHRDGIDLGGGMMEVLGRTGIVTREALADLARVSVRQLERLFRDGLGYGVHRHYLHLRLDRAHQLGRESALSRAEIATATGFASADELSRAERRRRRQAQAAN